MDDLFLSMILPAITGILVGDGVRGDALVLLFGGGDKAAKGELVPSVAAAINDLRSDRELRRFFFKDLTVSFGSSGGGEASIVVSLVGWS